jgi:hypothetical protein
MIDAAGLFIRQKLSIQLVDRSASFVKAGRLTVHTGERLEERVIAFAELQQRSLG